MQRLQDKVAIVTGGAQGIGAGIVRKFAQEGATVIIWDVKQDKANALVSELTSEGLKVDTVAGLDITKLSSAEDGAKQVADKYGRIDILINNAGIVRDASFGKMTEDEWDLVIAVNLKGVFNCAKAVLPYMKNQQYGKIVSLSSISGLFGNFGQTNYVAAKAGVAGMTKTWGRELGRYGINANAIAPGPIATDMLATVPEQMISAMKERLPVRRMGEPEDIANAALFFSSDESSFVTGQTLVVDGGSTLGG